MFKEYRYTNRKGKGEREEQGEKKPVEGRISCEFVTASFSSIKKKIDYTNFEMSSLSQN